MLFRSPFQGKKKGADTGIDGVKFFRDLDRKEVRKIVVSVKGGGIKPDDVRALNHVREREKAEIALFISLEQPTPATVKDLASVGFYESATKKEVCAGAVAYDRGVTERDATRRAS